MLVSVIYVNYKTSELTCNSIKSVIEKTKGVDYEIFVVDNASQDSIEEDLKQFDNVKLIKLYNNEGFGKGNNAAIKYCKGDFIFFLNTDTVLLNDAITILADALNSNPKYIQVGANLFHANGKPNQSFLYTHSLYTEIRAEMPSFLKRNHYRKDMWFNFTDKPKNVGYISGAATMLPRSWVTRYGGFDEDFFMYYEDMELSVRVKKTKGEVLNIPQAHICHLGGGSSGNDSQATIVRHGMLCKSKYCYYRKVKNEIYATCVHFSLQIIYSIYATFAGVQKRALYKQMIKNDREGCRK